MHLLSTLGWYLEVALVFLIMMTVLVAAHEYGHYLFARMFGMGVEEFAIGMGKKLCIWRRKTYEVEAPDQPPVYKENEFGELTAEEVDARAPTETTEFTIRALPVGGFVRIKGMAPQDDGSEVHVPGGFYSKAPWKRFLVLLAGPLFSVLAGIAVLVPVYSIAGMQRPNQAAILGTVSKTMPAGKAGLQDGDRVTAVNGRPISKFYDMVSVVATSSGKPLRFTVERKGKLIEATVTPELKDGLVMDPNLDLTGKRARVGRIGVGPELRKERLSVGEAIDEAVTLPVRAVTGLLGLFQQPSTFEDNVGGPATMVNVVAQGTEQGVDSLLMVAALLSISVGIMNLLPFVPLDGGQMLVAVAEMLRGGKRLSIRVQEMLQNVGATLVLVLIIAVLFVDFKRFVFPEKDTTTSKPAATSAPVQRSNR